MIDALRPFRRVVLRLAKRYESVERPHIQDDAIAAVYALQFKVNPSECHDLRLPRCVRKFAQDHAYWAEDWQLNTPARPEDRFQWGAHLFLGVNAAYDLAVRSYDESRNAFYGHYVVGKRKIKLPYDAQIYKVFEDPRVAVWESPLMGIASDLLNSNLYKAINHDFDGTMQTLLRLTTMKSDSQALHLVAQNAADAIFSVAHLGEDMERTLNAYIKPVLKLTGERAYVRAGPLSIIDFINKGRAVAEMLQERINDMNDISQRPVKPTGTSGPA
jgi:hypothetical protein